jgi:hypothetical protein
MQLYVFVNGRQLMFTEQGNVGFTGYRKFTIALNRIVRYKDKVRALEMQHNLSNAVGEVLIKGRYKPEKVKIEFKRVLDEKPIDPRASWEKRNKRKLDKRMKWIEESREEIKDIEKQYKQLLSILSQSLE